MQLTEKRLRSLIREVYYEIINEGPPPLPTKRNNSYIQSIVQGEPNKSTVYDDDELPFEPSRRPSPQGSHDIVKQYSKAEALLKQLRAKIENSKDDVNKIQKIQAALNNFVSLL